MRLLTFGATLAALIGSISGLVLWLGDGPQDEPQTRPRADPSSQSNSLPQVQATIRDCTEQTELVARELGALRIDDIVKLDLSAPQDEVFVIDRGNNLAEAAGAVSADFRCSEDFPPGLQVTAANLEGRNGWSFEHGVYELIGTFALQQSGVGTGGVQWYQFRQVRPEDVR